MNISEYRSRSEAVKKKDNTFTQVLVSKSYKVKKVTNDVRLGVL